MVCAKAIVVIRERIVKRKLVRRRESAVQMHEEHGGRWNAEGDGRRTGKKSAVRSRQSGCEKNEVKRRKREDTKEVRGPQSAVPMHEEHGGRWNAEGTDVRFKMEDVG